MLSLDANEKMNKSFRDTNGLNLTYCTQPISFQVLFSAADEIQSRPVHVHVHQNKQDKPFLDISA
jgi:hypothetical protein